MRKEDEIERSRRKSGGGGGGGGEREGRVEGESWEEGRGGGELGGRERRKREKIKTITTYNKTPHIPLQSAHITSVQRAGYRATPPHGPGTSPTRSSDWWPSAPAQS